MDLLKYLEPMKNLPERFSNLAFWRGVRKLRDEVVNAFEYVDSWGENIEHDIANAGNIKLISAVELTTTNTAITANLLFKDSATNTSYYNLLLILQHITPPTNAKYAYIHAECDISDLPNNTNFTVSNFMPLTPTFYISTGLGTIPFQTMTGAPHFTALKNAFVFFYG